MVTHVGESKMFPNPLKVPQKLQQHFYTQIPFTPGRRTIFGIFVLSTLIHGHEVPWSSFADVLSIQKRIGDGAKHSAWLANCRSTWSKLIGRSVVPSSYVLYRCTLTVTSGYLCFSISISTQFYTYRTMINWLVLDCYDCWGLAKAEQIPESN